MYTQCPECRTIFEIDEDALQASLGIVRCGHCQQRFDALRTLSNTLPLEADSELPEQDPEARAPTLTEAVTPDAIKASADRVRRRRASSAPDPEPGPDSPPPATAAHWLDSADARTRALIADAAGIPHEAIQDDASAWAVIDIPVQASFAGLDIIPMVPDPPAPATESPSEPAQCESDAAPWSADDQAADAAADAAGPMESQVADEPSEHVAPSNAGESTRELTPTIDNDVPPDGIEAATDIAPTRLADDDLTAWSDAADTEPEPAAPPDAAPVDADVVDTDAGNTATAPPLETDADPAVDDLLAPEPVPDTGPATTDAPVYIPPRPRRIRRSDWLWAFGCLVLALALVAQVAWARRSELVRNPATRAWVLQACASIDCRLAPIRDVAKLELLSRDIRPDPKAAGALTITATLRNDAPFRQPWPIVVVELTDLDNDPVAMRRFRPVEYLPDPARRAAGIAPGATAAVAFEVADPGKRAVAFHFSFD